MKPKAVYSYFTLSFFAISAIILTTSFQNCGPQFQYAEYPSSGFSPPQIMLQSAPPALTNSRTLNLNLQIFTDSLAKINTATCQFDMEASVDCSKGQFNLTNMADGDHTIRINATDTNGLLATERIYNFRVDATAPVVTISQAPATLTGNTTANISFSATDALSPVTSVTCTLDSQTLGSCMSPLTLTNLSAGAHTFRIKATDAANNTSEEKTATWTVDLTAPSVTIATQPARFSNTNSANFTFSGQIGSVALTNFECSIDGGTYTLCTSPKAYSSLSDGNHNFSLRGVTVDGIRSSPSMVAWTVDTTLPTTPTFSSSVSSPTTSTSATISFSSTDAGSMIASYRCSFDGGAYTTCISPQTYSNLAVGNHSLAVRAVDNAANVSAIGTHTWAVNEIQVVIDGPALYTTNCSSCHGPLATSVKQNRTATQIQNAINSVSQMSHLKSLTAAQINGIAMALVKKVDIATNPFACTTGEMGVNVLRRLTKREYTNTVLDLFSGQIALTDIQNELLSVQAEFTNEIPSVRVFDSTNPVGITLPQLKAYEAVATKAADVITANTTKMSVIGGTCITGTTVTDTCVNAFLDNFGLKTLRRPLTATEKTNYLTLYRSGTSSSDSMARVIQALMLAPHFLYKMESNGTAVSGRTDLFQLTPYEIASRLSYGILGTMPDQALFDAAKAGTLSTSTGLQTQVDRLFGLSKAREGIRSFYSQLLRLDYIPEFLTTNNAATGLSLGTLRSEARQEISDLMDYLIWTQKSNFSDLMTTKVAIPQSSNLAKIYGVQASSTPVTLTDPNRAGILTRVGLLAMDADGGSRPVKRGVNVRLHLLCDPLGAPPANTESLAGPVDYYASIRDQITAKTSPTQCMACHGRINPAGFAFENFDGFGRFRTQETVIYNGQTRTHQINAVVSPAIVSESDPQVNGAAELQQVIANSSSGQACMAKQWLQYNTGRDATAADNCALSTMYDAGTKAGGSIYDMLKSYTRAPAFTLKKLGPQ